MTDNERKELSQYLTFRLDDELFALNVSQVREVLDMSPITKVPKSPGFMKGVINVRGSVVPVIDLRIKFGLPEKETDLETRIIIMDLVLDDESTVIGALADSVHEVKDLDQSRIEAPPKLGARWRSEFIKGIGKSDDQFIMILDIDRVFSSDELAFIGEVESASALPETKSAAG